MNDFSYKKNLPRVNRQCFVLLAFVCWVLFYLFFGFVVFNFLVFKLFSYKVEEICYQFFCGGAVTSVGDQCEAKCTISSAV